MNDNISTIDLTAAFEDLAPELGNETVYDLDSIALSPASEWTDITETLKSSSKLFSPGELISSSTFNLFDSMSAIELMDAKMDAGYIPQGCATNGSSSSSHFPIDYRLAHNLIPLSFASGEPVVVQLMDYVFQCEMSWLNGQTLAQTLYTCLYVHPRVFEELTKKKNRAQDEHYRMCLGAYCGGVIRTFALLRKIILYADIYEEEDFNPNCYQVDLASNLSDEEALEGLHRAIEVCESNKDDPMMCQIRERLQYRLLFFNTLLDMHTRGPSTTKERVEQMKQDWTETRARLFSLSLNYGERLDDIPGIDPDIVRCLSSTSPPRSIHLLSMESSIDFCSLLIQDLMLISSSEIMGKRHLLLKPAELISEYIENIHSFEDCRRFLVHFSTRKRELKSSKNNQTTSESMFQQPNVAVRSILVVFLYHDEKIFGRSIFPQWLSESMVNHGVPKLLLQTQEGSQFMARCIRPLYEILKLYTLNYSRQRQRIELLIKDWSVLQQEATNLDAQFVTEMNIPKSAYPRYCSGWSMEMMLVLMIDMLELGLQLGLYDVLEYPSLFWYLDSLVHSRIQNLNFMAQFLHQFKQLEQQQQQQQQQASSSSTTSPLSTCSKSKSKKKPGSKNTTLSRDEEGVVEPDMVQLELALKMQLLEMKAAQYRGLFQSCAAIEKEQPQVFAFPPNAYSSQALRYYHRFRCFESISYPPFVSYDEYQQHGQMGSVQPLSIYRSAGECFKRVRKTFDRVSQHPTCSAFLLSDLQPLLKASVANGVTISRMMMIQDRCATKEERQESSASIKDRHILFQFSIHPTFPWIQFQSS